MTEPLRTADGELVTEGLYLQDGRTLYKVSTLYERLVTLQVCLEKGALTSRTRVREYATEKVRHLRTANPGLVDRYHALLDAPTRTLGQTRPHGWEPLVGAADGTCRLCGLSQDNPVHRGEGLL